MGYYEKKGLSSQFHVNLILTSRSHAFRKLFKFTGTDSTKLSKNGANKTKLKINISLKPKIKYTKSKQHKSRNLGHNGNFLKF
ncbi:hypothetical protein BpHYR1_021686 [Brachionus plicatilis]|uniref:Uncharacterized protein n=1 Tax=Brachionus plicatilis TaxID=10195 RepID=A0A3M7RUJ0_BRAPC|nr:hypothetical protein BpHYR1_021686 [Brachionus plicatilis]